MTTEVSPDTIAPETGSITEEFALPAEAEVADETVVAAAVAEPVATETAAPPRPLYERSEDEWPEDVRETIRRREQAATDRARAAEQRQADERLAGYVARGEYTDELATAYSVDADGNVQVDRSRVNDIVGRLQGGLAQRASAQAYQTLSQILPYADMGAEGRERVREAGDNWIAAYLTEIGTHLARTHEPEQKKQWEADYRRQQQERATVQQREQASAARVESAAPTAGIVGAGPAGQIASMADADAAYDSGTLSHDQYIEQRIKFGLSREPGR